MNDRYEEFVFREGFRRGYQRGKADRPQGEWIEESYDGRIYGLYRIMFKCSTCGYVPMHRGEPIIPTSKTLRFCPNCGADMRGEDNETDRR